ncbi:MAG: DUF481 domain-containing protein [Victivallales bacterium]|nr:DUF481 domain-containing protein [Victivallales bacterium]
MHFNNWSKWMAVALAAGMGVVSADQVKLTDGTTIVGNIKEIFGGKIKVATGFAGDIAIDADKVQSISTDGKVSLYTAGATTSLTGVLSDNSLKIGDVNPTVTSIDLGSVTALWPEGGKDPTVKDTTRKWGYEAAFDFAGKTGNTEKNNLGASFQATLKGPEDKLLLYAKTFYGKENGVENERKTILGADFERHIADTKNTWYVRTEWKYDKYADLDPDWTSAAGYGFYLIDTDDVKVRGRLGLAYVYRDYISDREHDSSFGLDANYHHEIKIKELGPIKNLGTFVTDITYTPQFDDFGVYHIFHESSLAIPLGGSKFWTLRLGVSNDYYSEVAKDKDRLSTTYFARLVLSWE